MKHVNLVVSLLLLAGALVLCQRVITTSRANQARKSAYAELNSVKYGMFSIDAWKDQLIPIVTGEFDKLEVSEKTEKEVREHVSAVLNKMIDAAAAKIEKANEKTFKGKLKQAFIDTFVDIEDIKKGVPEYTDAVMKELKKPKTQQQIKTVLDKQVAEYATKTSGQQDRSKIDAIIASTGTKDVDGARRMLEVEIATDHKRIVYQSALIVGIAVILFALFALNKAKTIGSFLVVIVSLVVLLASGVATPMIDMEAKISKLAFVLIGSQVLFENQVLYFQSKSILDVFWLMITDGQLQMKLVGVLVVLFSVVIPLLKLLATVAYYLDFRIARRRAAVSFLVHKIGKWSMADVLVVAIFMAYIGFNGVINSQLKDLNFPDSGVDLIATNGTSLQPGFFLFLTYVLLSLVMSGLLSRTGPEAKVVIS